MRRSKKETVLLQADNRLLQNDMQESMGSQGASFTMESAQDWAAGSASVKTTARKPAR